MNPAFDFNYAAWTAGSSLHFSNVSWNSDYRDIVKFDSDAALNSYLANSAGAKIDLTALTYAKFGQPVRVNTPFNVINRYNYLRVYNPAQPVPGGDFGQSFYYFVTEVRYVAPNTTEIMIQLDVWQTFGRQVQFGNCYIERGHVGMANSTNFAEYGREFLTIPEGLDIGGEYNISHIHSEKIARAREEVGYSYNILIHTTVSLSMPPGTQDAPNLNTAQGSLFEGLPNGAETYLIKDPAVFFAFMALVSDTPWVSQGIVSIMAIPPADMYNVVADPFDFEGLPMFKVGTDYLNNRLNAPSGMADWRDTVKTKAIPARYRHLNKFMTYPYTVVEMTANNGTPIIIKPESWQDEDGKVLEIPHFSLPSPRMAFIPYRYNASAGTSPKMAPGTTNEVYHDGGEFLDMATWINNFPTFSIVNNSYIGYMASNNNSLAFQHSSADWSQQKALQGASTGYDQATAGMDLQNTLTGLGIAASRQQNDLANQNAVYGGIKQGFQQGMAGGAVGGIGGAAAGIGMAAADTAMAVHTNNTSTGISNRLSQSSNDASVANSGYMRDTNKSYADYAANGDYQNNIAGISAKTQDARLTQPTTSGQMGGDAFNLARYQWGYDLKVKTLQPAALAIIGEYWLRYGYAVSRFGRLPASLMVMNKFTYWKLKETYIISATVPESFKQAIRGIFESGVTVWANPSDMGNIDIADNTTIPGAYFG